MSKVVGGGWYTLAQGLMSMYRKTNDKTRAFLAIFITFNAFWWLVIAIGIIF